MPNCFNCKQKTAQECFDCKAKLRGLIDRMSRPVLHPDLEADIRAMLDQTRVEGAV